MKETTNEKGMKEEALSIKRSILKDYKSRERILEDRIKTSKHILNMKNSMFKTVVIFGTLSLITISVASYVTKINASTVVAISLIVTSMFSVIKDRVVGYDKYLKEMSECLSHERELSDLRSIIEELERELNIINEHKHN